MRDSIIRVVKVGGSLFDVPDLICRIEEWMNVQSPAMNIFIAGGGQLVEDLRERETVLSLDKAAYHWLCVDALKTTAQTLSELLAANPFIRRFEHLRTILPFRQRGSIVYDVFDFLHHHEPKLPGVKLPQNWSVTSDSIAARLAEVISADELVLLKSATAPAGGSLANLATLGYVDAFFPQAAATLPCVRLVNLRDEGGG